MDDANPYKPSVVGSSEIRPVENRSKYLYAFFVCCFTLTLLVPVVQYRQVNDIHHLPLFIAYVGLFFPESRVFAILYVAGHLACCLVVSLAAVQCMRLVENMLQER